MTITNNALRLFPEDYPDFSGEGAPACSEVDPDLFFPVDRDEWIPTGAVSHRNGAKNTIYRVSANEMKKVCDDCPYAAECLGWALRHNEPGIWGGTTEYDRKRIKQGRPLR